MVFGDSVVNGGNLTDHSDLATSLREKVEIEKHTANVGYQRIKEACEQLNISPVSLEPYFRQSVESGANPYRDNIHPNKVGQQLIAKAVMAHLPKLKPANSRTKITHANPK